MVAAAPAKGVVKCYYERPWLYAKQREAIFEPLDYMGQPARYSMIEASTKAGKTAGCMAWLYEQAILDRKGRNHWWVAPVYAQAKIAFRRFRRGMPKAMFRANEAEMYIELPNGAVMWFKSGEKPDNLYGEDVASAVVDEASRVREESYFAIRSTLTATRGHARFIGNVKGRKNWFYRLARRAQQGTPGYAHYKMTAFDAVDGGVLQMAEIEQARADLPDHIFRELYLAEPSDDGGNPFGLQHIEACLAPLSDEPPVAIGIDLAKSVDYTVVVGMDRFGRVCGMERWNKVPWNETEERISDIVGPTPALMDATGVGAAVYDRVSVRRPSVQPFVFTAATKQALLGQLAVAVQNHDVAFPDGVLREEMDEFEYVSKPTGVHYSAPEGLHDDCVIALALCWQMYQTVRPFAASRAGETNVSRVSPWFGRQ